MKAVVGAGPYLPANSVNPSFSPWNHAHLTKQEPLDCNVQIIHIVSQLYQSKDQAMLAGIMAIQMNF
jgi:hypothetical protein